jgi:hypothetical protein
MPKPKATVVISLPGYVHPRTEWRRQIYRNAAEAIATSGVSYANAPSLELLITLRLSDSHLALHDVDNRLKDIMDALQGCLGGAGKKVRVEPPLIPNDNRIFRVVVQKTRISPKAAPGGSLKIKQFKMPPLLAAAMSKRS